MSRTTQGLAIIALSVMLPACTTQQGSGQLVIPAIEYSNYLRGSQATTISPGSNSAPSAYNNYGARSNSSRQAIAPAAHPVANRPRANASPRNPDQPQVHMASQTQSVEGDYVEGDFRAAYGGPPEGFAYGPDGLNPGDYNGPLSLGDPGVSASLWRDSSNTPDFFRDSRAWQPMDLITIMISESAEGTKEADTEIKSKSTLNYTIDYLLGYEDLIPNKTRNSDGTLDPRITASSQNNFKGEGDTTRKGELKATLSAMVMEVLPSGILRIEGTKIISVNNEEQVMVLSGLVRTRDVSSDNEVDSARIANMRIDYYGRGQVGGAQNEGWLGHIVRKVWPF